MSRPEQQQASQPDFIRTTKVYAPGDRVIHFPEGTPAHEIQQHMDRLFAATPTSTPLQQAIPPDAGIRAKTFSDRVRDVKDSVGRTIAPVLGVNFDQMAADEANGRLYQMMLYHGSPHLFDQFDMSKIGTGEGAAAYGHGLYFAENPAVAEGYHTRLATSGFAPSDETLAQYFKPGDIVPGYGGRDEVIAFHPPNPNATGYWDQNWSVSVREAKYDKVKGEWVPNPSNPIRRHTTTPSGPQIAAKLGPDALPGGVYKADLPDEHVANMLDWDKPLAEQPHIENKIRGAIKDRIDQFNRIDRGYKTEHLEPWLSRDLSKYNGGDIYYRLGDLLGYNKAGTSRFLNDAGIPGIKYFDQFSRGAENGTRNFVLFDTQPLRSVEPPRPMPPTAPPQ